MLRVSSDFFLIYLQAQFGSMHALWYCSWLGRDLFQPWQSYREHLSGTVSKVCSAKLWGLEVQHILAGHHLFVRDEVNLWFCLEKVRKMWGYMVSPMWWLGLYTIQYRLVLIAVMRLWWHRPSSAPSDTTRIKTVLQFTALGVLWVLPTQELMIDLWRKYKTAQSVCGLTYFCFHTNAPFMLPSV